LVLALFFILLLAAVTIFAHNHLGKAAVKVLGLLGLIEGNSLATFITEISTFRETNFQEADPIISGTPLAQAAAKVDTRKTSILAGAELFPTSQRKSSYFSETEGLTVGVSESDRQRPSKKKINIDEKSKSLRDRQADLMKTKLTEGWRTWLRHCLFAVLLTVFFVSDYIATDRIIQSLLTSNAVFDYTCKRI
jgi:hypothetical protein